MKKSDKIFRCTIFFTEERFRDTPASNFFLYAESNELATDACVQLFKKQLVEHGIPDAEFKCETIPSSPEEIELYQQSMKNKTAPRMVN